MHGAPEARRRPGGHKARREGSSSETARRATPGEGSEGSEGSDNAAGAYVTRERAVSLRRYDLARRLARGEIVTSATWGLEHGLEEAAASRDLAVASRSVSLAAELDPAEVTRGLRAGAEAIAAAALAEGKYADGVRALSLLADLAGARAAKPASVVLHGTLDDLERQVEQTMRRLRELRARGIDPPLLAEQAPLAPHTTQGSPVASVVTGSEGEPPARGVVGGEGSSLVTGVPEAGEEGR